MQLRELFDDDDAVSPVIGVILMVAITVILAAVIATFVLGLGEQVSQTAPQASFTFDYNEGAASGNTDSFGHVKGDSGDYDGLLTITHAGGATLEAQNLGISGATNLNDGNWASGTSNDPQYADGSEISAGDSLEVWVSSDDTIQVTWKSEGGSQSATLRVWRGPDA